MEFTEQRNEKKTNELSLSFFWLKRTFYKSRLGYKRCGGNYGELEIVVDDMGGLGGESPHN